MCTRALADLAPGVSQRKHNTMGLLPGPWDRWAPEAVRTPTEGSPPSEACFTQACGEWRRRHFFLNQPRHGASHSGHVLPHHPGQSDRDRRWVRTLPHACSTAAFHSRCSETPSLSFRRLTGARPAHVQVCAACHPRLLAAQRVHRCRRRAHGPAASRVHLHAAHAGPGWRGGGSASAAGAAARLHQTDRGVPEAKAKLGHARHVLRCLRRCLRRLLQRRRPSPPRSCATSAAPCAAAACPSCCHRQAWAADQSAVYRSRPLRKGARPAPQAPPC